MKKMLTALLTASAVSLAAAQTTAAPTTPAPIKLATTATVSPASLSLSAASRIAALAVNNCAQLGYNVSATVVDRSGVILAVARSENAGPHTLGASSGKAFTSASARALTSDIAKNLPNNPTLADIPGYLVLAGGAPSGLVDEKCGTDAVATVLGK